MNYFKSLYGLHLQFILYNNTNSHLSHTKSNGRLYQYIPFSRIVMYVSAQTI